MISLPVSVACLRKQCQCVVMLLPGGHHSGKEDVDVRHIIAVSAIPFIQDVEFSFRFPASCKVTDFQCTEANDCLKAHHCAAT